VGLPADCKLADGTCDLIPVKKADPTKKCFDAPTTTTLAPTTTSPSTTASPSATKRRCKARLNGESCNGAIVENGTNETIIDANNAVWTIFSNSTVFKDGLTAGPTGNVILLVYWNGIVYHENKNLDWWQWINDNNSWISEYDTQVLSYLTSSSGCTPTTVSDLSTSLETTTVETSSLSYISNKSSSNYFAPYSCNDSNYIGLCIEMNETDFICNCSQGYMGIHCQDMINYCNRNVTCLNEGICRPILLDYKCECLYGSSGRHCENLAAGYVIRQYVAKSFSYIAIIGIVAVYLFVIILDTLKYVFGIDVTRNERRELRHKRNSHKKKNLEEQQARKTHLVLRYID
ncbi:unnamed protein product, partial [Adineta steineri]